MSPTQRTLAYLKGLGYTAAVVEHWNAFAKLRQDLFGAFDIVAVHPHHTGVLGVQCTTTDNMAERQRKLRGLDAVAVWLAAGNRAWVVGWGKRGPRGGRKVWAERIVALSVAHDTPGKAPSRPVAARSRRGWG